MRHAAWIALLTIGMGSAAAAQDHDPQIWTYATLTAPLDSRTAVQLETAHRYSGDQSALYEGQYIVTLQREIAKDVTVIVGYNRVVSSTNGSVTATEHRPRQMIAFPIARVGTASLTGRLRAEQRFRSDDSRDGHRVRAEYRLTIPVDTRGRAIRVMHEDYLNLNTTGFQRAGYERMRNAVSLLLPAGKARLELGYLNQWRFNRAPRRDAMAHALLVGIAIGL